ncbi:MAG: ribosome biogenesis GTPase Der [Bacteroidales bacterium]|nr:ribosome biogenesis GTPase Der [Bacteroidales bacterium]MCF8386468.1 ribosome biogenesis GTPase Der [Bacteroidales bacterium]MCF8399416.1 ribosome biogenesis GTPase Der [Bacteroidales bacterium]
MSNIIAIVGRPNVGKSTLFNRLTESRQAIVDETSGVTRDRHYGKGDWNGYDFSVIDTGGYIQGSDDVFEKEIRKQAEIAIEEADVILFVLDSMQGLTGMDQDVAKILRQTKKKVLIVANKVDNSKLLADATEFYKLGMGEVYSVSAINGSGTGELLDAVVQEFGEQKDAAEIDLPRFAVVGRPNVGKSSFINAIIGEDRNIVTPVAGTTRDTVNTKYNLYGFEFMIMDTAGLRRKTRVKENIEFYSVLRSIRAIEKSDVCLLIVDGSRDFESQDVNIFHLAEKNKKGVVILVNKWDLVEKETNTYKEYEDRIRSKIAPFNDVPIIFTSVVNKQRIYKALEAGMQAYKNKTKKISGSKLNETLLPVIKATPPPMGSRNKMIKIKYVAQLPVDFPAFAFFCNHPDEIKEQYKRFLERKLRKAFDFRGVPVQLYFRQK